MYITPVNFHLPHKLIWQIHKQTTVSFSDSDDKVRNPIYRQLNKMVMQNIQISEPIELIDQELNQSFTVTPEALIRMRNRYTNTIKEWNMNYAFREQELPNDLQQQVKSHLPIDLQKLDPKVAMQSKKGVDGILAPHRDHARTASLFFLLESNNEETVWWEKTEDFEEFDFFRFADITKIKRAHSEIIKRHQWYIFNNVEYHSVHPTGPVQGARTTLCIEFNGVSADELYNIINNGNH